MNRPTMPEPLHYLYRIDWRVPLGQFRAQSGMRILRQKLFRQLLRHVAIAALLGVAVLALLFTKAWPIALALAGVFFYRARLTYRLAQQTRRAKFALRKSFRDTPARSVRLTVDDRGVHERDGDIESSCPWASVRSYSYQDGTLTLSLANRLVASVSEAQLTDGSSTLAELVALCKHHGVPYRDATPS